MGPALRHLLIRAPNWVGDLVMATPVLEAAVSDERFERVTIAVRAPLERVLADGPCAPHVSVTPRRGEASAWRILAPDAVLLLTSSFAAAARAFRARVPLRAGAALSGRGALLTHKVVPPARDGRRVPIPTAHLLRDVAGLLGIRVPTLHPRLAFREELARDVRASLERRGLARGEPYVLCAPAAAFGAAKLWPPEHFARALDLLHERFGWRAVITGGPGEEPQMRAVRAATRHGALCLDEEPRDLERLKPLVAGAQLLLVGDSGPRWYAAAFDVPCVSVMGPNFPELTASSLERCRVLRVEGLECAPCLERTCPLGHHRCMRELAPERALEAATELVGHGR
jgi:heptosyltransferase-2